MSWFKRDSPFRSSLRAKLSAAVAQVQPVEHDARACFESFKNHWQQAWEMMCHSQNTFSLLPKAALADQISGVLNHLDQMLSLLLHDLRRHEESIGPLLDLVLTEDILYKLLSWSLQTGEFVSSLKLEQLKLYEMLITQSQHVLVHKPILQPLLKLLSTCNECSPVEVEKRLVILLNQLCVSLTQNTALLEFFFSANCNQGSANFLIFSLLIPFVHREGAIGQQARDALLLCMSLSRKNDKIGIYIAKNSTFCPVLATGLSGLYSLLPRKLVTDVDDWHRFTPDDVKEIPELLMFLNSLEFCNAVIQVSHPLVQQQLLEYLNQGFLYPVLIPALQPSLQQACVEELATTTAYLDLFLRSISEPSLLQAFLRILFLKTSESAPVIESLILRIGSQQPLCVITLALFGTLLSLNCEDVMLDLVFKYLVPCTHIMVSQRCRVRDVDMFGKSAEKFLALMPSCCLPHNDDSQDSSGPSSLDSNNDRAPPSLPRSIGRRRRAPSTTSYSPGDGYETRVTLALNPSQLLPGSFHDYLLDARQMVTSCFVDCHCWSWAYDGESPPPEALSDCEITNGVGHPRLDDDVKSFTGIAAQDNVNITADEISRSPLANEVPALSNEDDEGFVLKPSGLLPSVDQNGAVAGVVVSSKVENSKSNIEHTSSHPTKLKFGPPVTSKTVAKDGKTKLHHLPFLPSSLMPGQSNPPVDGFGSPNLGPFLSILLSKLENMMNNSVYENLLLTGVIARLACYPQPLLRSFLLNHSLVFQPSVRSLLQVLGTLKQKVDSFFYTVDNIEELMYRARRFLAVREERINSGIANAKLPGRLDRRSSTPDGVVKVETKRWSFTDRIFRRSQVGSEKERTNIFRNILDGIPNDTGYRYVKPLSTETSDGKLESLRMKNAVLCVVVLEEFLKELSAIAMEHAVIWEENPKVDLSWL